MLLHVGDHHLRILVRELGPLLFGAGQALLQDDGYHRNLLIVCTAELLQTGLGLGKGLRLKEDQHQHLDVYILPRDAA